MKNNLRKGSMFFFMLSIGLIFFFKSFESYDEADVVTDFFVQSFNFTFLIKSLKIFSALCVLVFITTFIEHKGKERNIL